MIQVDKNVCVGCGACIKDCVSGTLALKNGKAEAKGDCFSCGHCVAVCPVGCVSIPAYDMEDVEEFARGQFQLDGDGFLRALKFRRSVRFYQRRQVEQETMGFLLQAGRYSATAVNSQGCRFIFVQDRLSEFKTLVWSAIGGELSKPQEAQPEGMKAFRSFYERRAANPEDDFLFRNAPAVVLIASNNLWDAGLAAQSMELAAVSQGLGMLYNGYLTRAARLPGIPEWLGAGEKPLCCCMLLGYPDVVYHRTAPRRKADALFL